MRLRPSRESRFAAYFGVASPTTIGQRAARGTALTVASQALKLATTLGSLAVLARLLTPADYGLLAMLLTFAAFVTVFKDLGLTTATIQREHLVPEQVSALFWVSTAVGVALAALSTVLAPAVAWFFHDARLTAAIAVSSVGFIFAGASSQHLALLSRSLRFGALAATDLLSLIVASAAGVLLALGGAGYWSLVLMQPTIPLVQMLLAFFLAGWTPSRPHWTAGLGDMLRFGGNLTGFNFLNYFARNGDNILIGRSYSAADLGAYTRAYSLLLAPISQINAPVGNVAVPALSRIGLREPLRYRNAYVRMLSKLCIVTMPLVAFCIVTADWVVAVALGPQWGAAASIFVFLGFAGLVEPIGNSTGWLFITQNRTRDMLRWGACNLPLTIVAFLIGLPFGPEGVAAAYAIYSIARMPVLFWVVGRQGPVGVSTFYSAALPGAVAALGLACTTLALRYALGLSKPLPSLAITAVAGTAAATLCLMAFPAGRAQIRDMKRMAGRAFGR